MRSAFLFLLFFSFSFEGFFLVVWVGKIKNAPRE